MIVYDFVSNVFVSTYRALKVAAFIENNVMIVQRAEELHHLMPLRTSSSDYNMSPIDSATTNEDNSTCSTLLTDSTIGMQYHLRSNMDKSILSLENEINDVEPINLLHSSRHITRQSSAKSTNSTDAQPQKIKFVKYIGIIFSFIAIVTAWGFVDTIIQIIADGNLKHEAMYYAATFSISFALLIIYMNTCNREYSMQDAMELC